MALYFLATCSGIVGLYFVISAAVGIIRFPSFAAKIHAASIADSAGFPLCLFALSLLQDNWVGAIKLWCMIVLLLLLGPIASHALIKAAWQNNEELQK